MQIASLNMKSRTGLIVVDGRLSRKIWTNSLYVIKQLGSAIKILAMQNLCIVHRVKHSQAEANWDNEIGANTVSAWIEYFAKVTAGLLCPAFR